MLSSLHIVGRIWVIILGLTLPVAAAYGGWRVYDNLTTQCGEEISPVWAFLL